MKIRIMIFVFSHLLCYFLHFSFTILKVLLMSKHSQIWAWYFRSQSIFIWSNSKSIVKMLSLKNLQNTSLLLCGLFEILLFNFLIKMAKTLLQESILRMHFKNRKELLTILLRKIEFESWLSVSSKKEIVWQW